MRKEILVLILTSVYFCTGLASAETMKTKQNFVSRSEFKGHNCCQISRVGGWTNYNPRKNVKKQKAAVSQDLAENKNKAAQETDTE